MNAGGVREGNVILSRHSVQLSLLSEIGGSMRARGGGCGGGGGGVPGYVVKTRYSGGIVFLCFHHHLEHHHHLSLSLSPCLCLCPSLSLSLSVCLTLSLSLCLCVSPSLSLARSLAHSQKESWAHAITLFKIGFRVISPPPPPPPCFSERGSRGLML